MPKILTQEEITRNYDLICGAVLKLLNEKNILSITVDNIIEAVPMAKGSFYKYYSSKEECLYKVVLRAEKELFDSIFALKGVVPDKKELINVSLKNLYLSRQSIALKVSPEDLDTILKKLPSEYQTLHKEKSENYFQKTLALFDLEEAQLDMGVLSLLMYSLHYIAISHRNTPGFTKASEEIIKMIGNYMLGGPENENQ